MLFMNSATAAMFHQWCSTNKVDTPYELHGVDPDTYEPNDEFAYPGEVDFSSPGQWAILTYPQFVEDLEQHIHDFLCTLRSFIKGRSELN